MEKKRNRKERKGKGGGGEGGRGVIYARVCGEEGKTLSLKSPSFLREWKGEKEKSHISIGPLNALSSLRRRRRRLSPLVQRKAKKGEREKEESIIASIQQREEGGGRISLVVVWLSAERLSLLPPGRVLLCAGDTKCAK